MVYRDARRDLVDKFRVELRVRVKFGDFAKRRRRLDTKPVCDKLGESTECVRHLIFRAVECRWDFARFHWDRMVHDQGGASLSYPEAKRLDNGSVVRGPSSLLCVCR